MKVVTLFTTCKKHSLNAEEVHSKTDEIERTLKYFEHLQQDNTRQ
jgi:hypothetical protein